MALPSHGQLLAQLPPRRADEAVDLLLTTPGVRIERIVSHGHASPPGFWYDQPEDEWVLVVSGSASIGFEDGSEQHLGPGDWLTLPAHRRHRVLRTASPTVWLAVFVGGC